MPASAPWLSEEDDALVAVLVAVLVGAPDVVLDGALAGTGVLLAGVVVDVGCVGPDGGFGGEPTPSSWGVDMARPLASGGSVEGAEPWRTPSRQMAVVGDDCDAAGATAS